VTQNRGMEQEASRRNRRKGLFEARPSFLPAVWLIVLTVAVALAALAAANDRLPGDVAILRWMQDLPLPGMAVSRLVRALTGTEVVLATGALVVALLWLFHRRREAVVLACGLALLPLLQHGLKELVDRPRPTDDVADLRAGFSSPSFPAGHVMSPTVLYGFLAYLSLRLATTRRFALALSAACLVVPALSGAVNVYVGVHWPSYVEGGYLWALVLLLPLFLMVDQARKQVAARKRTTGNKPSL